MPIEMGPILSFRGEADVAGPGPGPRPWLLSALVVADADPGPLAAAGATVAPEALWTVGKRTAYRYLFLAPIADGPSVCRYTLAGRSYDIALPAARTAPRMAYTSCNGFADLKAMKRVAVKNALWTRMRAAHEAAPYHLLIGGGDQVYADSLWETVPRIRRWNEQDHDAANRAKATSALRSDLERFYFELYAKRWAQPEVAWILARVPGVLMWDDHDLIDGWGSYPEERQTSEVFKAIGATATKAFRVFQQQLGDGEWRPGAIAPGAGGFTFGHGVGGIALLALDMRSQRTQRQVMDRTVWDRVYAWIEDLDPRSVDHLLVLSSIPVVYPSFDTLERLLGIVPGRQSIEDDLRDHWGSRPHQGERLRLIHRLLRLARETGIRPTILSGDVHVAAVGVVEDARDATAGTVIDQLISSAVVHPGPPAAVLFALRHLFGQTSEIDRGITLRMTDFPGTTDRFIGQRNYLSLEPDDTPADGRRPRIWANWIVEDERDPFVKVIHPLPAAGP